MNAKFTTNRFFSIFMFLILAYSVMPFNKLVAEQKFALSKNSDFSTEDRIFTRQDTIYMKVDAPDIDYTDIEKNEWRLKPEDGGNDFEARFKNNLNGTYTTKLSLNAADISESEWEWHARVEDDSDNKFEARVDIKITGSDDETDESFEITSMIVSIGSDFLMLQSATIFVNEQTQVLDNNNSIIAFTDLKVGDLIEVKANRNAEGNLVALRIKLEDNGFSDDEVELKGKIDTLTDSTLVVLGKQFYVDLNTETLDGDNNPITFSSLITGQLVEIKARKAGSKLVAERIKLEEEGANEIEFTGTIDAINSDSITVDGIVFTITMNTEILDDNNNPISAADLAVGMRVEVRGEVSEATLTATRIKIEDSNFSGDDEVEITATVTAVGENSLSTAEFTFTVDESTVILDNRNMPIALSDIKVGFVVEVHADVLTDSSLLATKIKVEDFFENEVELTGRIHSIVDSSLTVSDLLFIISDSTVIVDDDNNLVDFSSLQVGDLVEIHAEVLVNGVLLANHIEIEDDNDKNDEVELVGTIEVLNSDNLIVSGIQFFVDANTQVFDNDENSISFSQLLVRQIVEIKGTYSSSGQLLAVKIKLEDKIEDEVEITGVIDELTNDAITVFGRVFNITENTVVFDDKNNLAAFSDLAVGMLVEIRGDLLADSTLVAIRIKIEDGDNDEIELKGAIEALTANTLDLLGITFQVNESTEVLSNNNNPIAFNTLTLGQTVEVKAIRLADGSNIALRIKVEDVLLLSGTIKQVEINGVSVADTPIIFDANTIILGKFNLVIGLEDLSTGEFVEVRALQISGNNFFATKVKVQGTNIITDISSVENSRSSVPTGFELNQNYPNPFNPTTTIAFRIQGQSAASVQLTVYNVLGQAVQVLVNESMRVGAYAIEWDGRDSIGNLSASGVYIYRLKIGNEIKSKQMLLLK